MMYDLLIKKGTIVTAEEIFVGDIAIQGEKIVALGSEIPGQGKREIDAEGKYIFPGGVDVHTHLDMPAGELVSADDFTTGTIAAACGGTTTIVDFATQGKGESLAEALAAWHRKADGKAAIDYGFHMAVTDVNEGVLAEMPGIISAGYPSFKFYMTYDALRIEDGVLLRALEQAGSHGGLVAVHAENHYMIDYLVKQFRDTGKIAPQYHALSRPPIVETEAVGRAIKLAQLVDAPLYIVHLSCRESLEEVAAARAAGSPVIAETCPQYLVLSDEKYRQPDFEGAKYVISPPLRSADNQEALWQGLKEGLIQTVATDHCPFNFAGEKERGRDFFGNIPNGAPGIELRMALIYSCGVGTGLMSLQRFVEVTSTNPAKIFGMYPEKGNIAPGSDADIVIFDPEMELTIIKDILHERVDYTPYEGIAIKGFPVLTVAKGQVVSEKGTYTGSLKGCFIKRKLPVII